MNIRKVYIEFDAAAGGLMQYRTEALSGNLSEIRLPFDLNIFDTNYIKLELYEKADSNPVVVEGLDRLKYLVLGADAQTPALKDWKRRNPLLDSLAPADFKSVHEKFPALDLSDVTEHDMFGYEKISKSKLGDKGGIWAWHGLRKLEFNADDLPFNEINKAADERQTVAFYFYKLERDELDDLINVDDIRFDTEKNLYVAYLNTNLFGAALKNFDYTQPTFYGRLDFHFYNRRLKFTYSFPVELCVHDTRLDKNFANHLLPKFGDEVSIDFGTSSTCAAVMGEGGPELITLCGDDKNSRSDTKTDNNIYENPTNLMIYDWGEFFRSWQHGNANCPFLVTKTDALTDKDADFDSGYSVEELLKDVNADDRGQRRVRAVISELKSIPALPHDKREQIKIKPLNDVSDKLVYVTDDFNAENEFTLDPVAFYGFLLGRAINNPVRGKIYRRYNITFPVKFPDDVRKKICNSLAFGIRRALPRPLVEANDADGLPFISVDMLYEEPVACLGAIVANQLIIDHNSKAKPFAIFDLGGGTLDTAFGIFRPARDSELDFADLTIQIFGCGGNERVGGEKLIHRLAYKIYLDNRDLMIQQNIPFVLPSGEKFPQGLDGLLSVAGDDIANANVATLKENIARILFQYSDPIDNQINLIFDQERAPDTTHCKISLRDTADKIVPDLELEIVNVDDFLHDTISDIVDGFKCEMDNICSTDKIIAQLRAAGCDGYRPQDFTILLAGNASKQFYVEQIMRERFVENRIERIHNAKAVSDDNFSDRYKLNGKTAVAFGQLKLNNYFVDRSAYQIDDNAHAPFQFCVGYEDPGNGEFVPVIVPNDNSREWKRANRITVQHQTNLLVTDDPQYSSETLRVFNRSVIVDKDVKSRRPWLWLRVAPNAHNCIEYRVGDEQTFNANEPADENKILAIDLSN